jgi:L-asparaginase/Glu-tRNA(Gln) amidotransferase subunit D
MFDLASDWSSFYVLLVDPFVQKHSLWKYASLSWTPVSNWAFSSAINAAQQSNHLTVIRTGGTIQCYVNGTLLITTTNTDLSTGDTGYFAESYSTTTNVDVRFDNYLLRSPGLVGQ